MDLATLGRLPHDVLEPILRQLPQEYFTEWLLLLPVTHPVRQVVVALFFAREVRLVLSPLRKNQHPWDQPAVNIIRGPVDCDDFLKSNPDIRPQRVTLATLGDFGVLQTLVEAHRDWFVQCGEIDLVLESCELTDADMQMLEVFRHSLVKLYHGVVTHSCLSYLEAYGWTKFTRLEAMVNLRHGIGSWTAVRFPELMRSLDVSWDTIDAASLTLPSHLRELYLNGCDSPTLVCPPNLETLMFTRNKIATLDLGLLSPTLTTLQLSRNEIVRIEGSAFPRLLETLILSENRLHPADLARLLSHGWPPRLRMLRLDYLFLDSLACVYNLPEGLEVLSVRGNNLRQFDLDMPRGLVELDMSSVVCQSWPLVRFPPGLRRLTMSECKLTSLGTFELPESLESLILAENHIASLDSYPHWLGLVNLTELDLGGNSVSLGLWMPPRSLQTLNLALNQVDSFECALFQPGNSHLGLVHVDLTGNRISSTNLTIPPHLHTLILDYNPISEASFGSLSTLKHLSLQHCDLQRISFVPQKAHLESLDLRNNALVPSSDVYQQLQKLDRVVVRPSFKVNRLFTLVLA